MNTGNNIDPGTKIIEFTNYQSSVSGLLDSLFFNERLKKISKIIIKPNLLEAAPYPCTTDVECIRAIIHYVKKNNPEAGISLIEGSGGCETSHAFKALGYYELAKTEQIKLIDVDSAPLVKLNNKNAIVYKQIYLPEEVFNGFLISVPCLKDHLLTTITIGMKNLVGLLPEKHYGGYWSYKRSDVHRVGISNAIVDLNNYIKTGLIVVDGRIGQYGSHLPSGRQCSPAKNVLIGGYNVFDVDCRCAEILGHNPMSVKHLELFHEHNNS